MNAKSGRSFQLSKRSVREALGGPERAARGAAAYGAGGLHEGDRQLEVLGL